MFLDYILCQETMEEGGRRQGGTINNEIFVLFLYLEKVRKFRINTYMGHQDQDGEKVGQMSLFFKKSEAATDREKQKFIHFQVLLSYLS